jgi:hypothetical protein
VHLLLERDKLVVLSAIQNFVVPVLETLAHFELDFPHVTPAVLSMFISTKYNTGSIKYNNGTCHWTLLNTS